MQRGRARLILGHVGVSVLLLSIVVAAPTPAIEIIVAASEAEALSPVLAHLELELGEPFLVRSSSASEGLVASAGTSSCAVVVIIAEGGRSLSVLETATGNVLSRAFKRRLGDYATAISIVELIHLVQRGSKTRAAQTSVRIGGGLAVAGTTGDEGVLLFPSFGAAVEVDGFAKPDWFALGADLRLRFPGVHRHEEADVEAGYRRFGMTASVRVGARTTVVNPILTLGIGLAHVRVTASAGGRAETRDRVVGSVDTTTGVALDLWGGLSLELLGGLSVVINPAEYVAGGRVLREGRLRPTFGLWVGWTSRSFVQSAASGDS